LTWPASDAIVALPPQGKEGSLAATRVLPSLRPADFRGFRLDVAARGIVREYNRGLRPHGLSYVPYFVLLLLAADEGGLRPSDIAADLRLDGSSLSGHLDKLEAADLVERRPDADDRRVIRVHATTAGRRLTEELEPIGRALSAVEADLAPEALARVGRAVLTPAASVAAPRTASLRPRAGLVTTLRAATLTVPNSVVGRTLRRFAALVDERSSGAIRVEVHLPSAAPGGELQTLVNLRSGDVAIASITASVVGNLIPDAQLIELPYLLDSFAHARAFDDGAFAQKTLADGLAFGLASLGIIENGFRSLTTRDTAVRDPAQLAGVRLRVQQSPINVHLAEAFGAVAVPLPFPRLAEALRAGEIDAQENSLANIAGLALWSSQRYLIETRHALSAHMLFANSEILAALGSGAAIVRDAMHDAIAEQRRAAERLEHRLREELARHMTLITLDDAARDRFVAATRLVHERVARALGDDALARVLAAAVAASPATPFE
jgi:TRAP-type C4-dicarboxylate transport system substrate-binding protein/DNA-binding HxlR family transcriptional regulator